MIKAKEKRDGPDAEREQIGVMFASERVDGGAGLVQRQRDATHRAFRPGDTFVPGNYRAAHAKAYVYALCDSDGRTFYIGVTDEPWQRVTIHFCAGTGRIKFRMRQPGAHLKILEVHDDYDFALVRESELLVEYRTKFGAEILNVQATKFTPRAHGIRYYRDVPPVLNPYYVSR